MNGIGHNLTLQQLENYMDMNTNPDFSHINLSNSVNPQLYLIKELQNMAPFLSNEDLEILAERDNIFI